MTGSDFNFGPEGFWKLLAALIVIGLVAVVAAIIAGVWWLIVHVRFV